eukprot:3829296-Karenia_brevis.AAC.1
MGIISSFLGILDTKMWSGCGRRLVKKAKTRLKAYPVHVKMALLSSRYLDQTHVEIIINFMVQQIQCQSGLGM